MPRNPSRPHLLSRHPLQRLESPSRGFSALLHVVSLASFAYSFRYLVVNPNPINDSYGWHMQYLTVLGLSLATLTMFVGLLADLTSSRRLFRVKNALSITSAPMEILISFLYWSLYFINPKLVLPEWADFLDVPTDLSFHAFPTLFLFLDAILLSPPRQVSIRTGLTVSLAIALGYWYWIETCYSHNGFYPYPIFKALDTPARIALFGFSAVVMAVVGRLLAAMYGVINGTVDD